MVSLDVCEGLVAKYLERLSDDFESVPSSNGCFVVTPFTRPDGEAIEVEVEVLHSDAVRLSDMGDTLGYLYVNGLALSRSTLDYAKGIAMTHGVSLQRTALNIEAESSEIGDALHALIQSALEVTFLIQRRRPSNRVTFDNEVESFIIYSGVTYDTGYEINGLHEKHTYKFHINSGRNLLVQPIAASTESAAHTWAERWAYRFSDILGMSADWRPVAVLDDRSDRAIWTPHALAPIHEYAILWAERERLTELLAPAQ